MKRIVLISMVLLMLAGPALARTIVVAQDATWPPMEFLNLDKEIAGFDTDYMRAVAKEAGFDVTFKNVPWDGIFAGLDAGQYDAVCSAVTVTEDRKRAMDFSIPYLMVRQALVVPRSTTAKSLEDMKGKELGAQIGTTGYFAIKKVEGVHPRSYDEIGVAMEDLYNGSIDGVVCDDPVAVQYVLLKPEYAEKLKIAAMLETGDEQYGVAVKKGNKEVLDLINKGIEAVKAKGVDKELRNRWMGQ
jgi:polar amino acid transport system substrate-binding protein